MMPQSHEIVMDVLYPGFVPNGGAGIPVVRRRLGGVGPALAVHVILGFGLRVVGGQPLIADRPGRGDSAVVAYLTEVLLPEAKKGRAVNLGIAAHVVVDAGMEFLAVLVCPALVRLVLLVQEDGLRAPVVLLAGKVSAALEHQDLLSG